MKQDRVVWSQELVSASSIAALLGSSVVETDNERCPKAVPVPVSPAGTTIQFEPEVDDWQGADQVAVVLRVPPDVQPSARLRVDSGSHTPGLQGNDYVHCYYRHLDEGWIRLEFPYENMLIFGIPDDWHQVTQLSLTLSGQGEGEFLIGSIAIDKRERAHGPRLTDEELLAELALDWPGLEEVRRWAGQNDVERACEALVDYYQNRPRPRHPFLTQPSPQAGYGRQAADLICEHLILNQQLGREIDWRANPFGYLEWMHAFNRHYFLQTLVDAYLATGDEKYARELDYLLSTWIQVSPAPLTNDGGGDPAWETLSTACRVNHAWPRVWYALQHSWSFQPQTRLDMVKSFYEHAGHLLRYPTGHNWLVAESAALATIGILFPEFKKASEWRSAGLERLEREMQYQVYPDGAQFELTAGYHRMCLDLFADVWELATLNGHPLSRASVQRFESMFGYTMHITRPDGTRPSMNDAGSLDTSSAPELTRGHRLFGRDELLYVATGGETGKVPQELSHAFPYAGHYVMRTGWDRDALWAAIDAGPFGAAHQHEDKLSLELYAYGTRFVVDPGIASYLDDPWTHYARSTAAHNTVMVDGKGQARRLNLPRARYRVEEPEPACWGSSSRIDFLWAPYVDGYEGIEPEAGLVHSRLVLLVKPRFWLIWDLLAGHGPHEMSVLYHFSPMLVQYSDGDGVVRSNRLGLPNIELLPLGRPDAVEVVCGQQSPVQGWLAEGGKLVPAPTAIYRLRGPLPLAFGVVAAPFKSGVSSGLAVVSSESGSAASGSLRLQATVADPSGVQWDIVFAERPQELACSGALPDEPLLAHAQGILVRRTLVGQIEYVAGMNCRWLKLGGSALTACEEPRPLVEVQIGR